MAKKYPVRLSASERADLERLTSGGVISVRKYKRARVLLLADESKGRRALRDEELAKRVDVSVATVERIRGRYAQEGLPSAISEKPRPGRPRTFSGPQRAQITALACSTPPEGRSRWTLRLLADKLVEVEVVERIDPMTVREVLKKTN